MSELSSAIGAFLSRPKDMIRNILASEKMFAGRDWRITDVPAKLIAKETNSLRSYFETYKDGPGIWKWDVYFDAYDAGMKGFVGKDVNLMEIGVFSGGSLGMWRSYLGDKSHIYGLDIEPACKNWENEYTTVFVGDQSDKPFLNRSLDQVSGGIDIVVDDGSHLPDHMIASFEAIFPRMNPGGVYIVEDIAGVHNRFMDYVSGLSKAMCTMKAGSKKNAVEACDIQRWIGTITIAPYIVTVTKRDAPLQVLTSAKHGTIWAPFSAKAKTG